MTDNTTLPTISADGLIDLLKGVVSGKEDFVYSKFGGVCLYVNPTEVGEPVPDCGIGHLFHRAGVSLEELRDRWEMQSASVVAWKVLDITEGDEYEIAEALYILDTFQSLQDDGLTWGGSLERAIRDCENGMTGEQE